MLTRVENGVELEQLLRDAAALGFLADCQHGALVASSIREMAGPARTKTEKRPKEGLPPPEKKRASPKRAVREAKKAR